MANLAAMAGLVPGDVPGAGHVLGFLVYAAAAGLGLVLALVDARTKRLPNRLLLPAYPATAAALLLCTAMTGEWDRALWALLGCTGMWMAFYLYGMIGPRGHLGYGDVKLAGWLGMLLGYAAPGTPEIFLRAILVAFVSAALAGIILILIRRLTIKDSIAFGPFLILGAAVAIALPGI
ncbi:leader peptidase (prepilin peptidase)/N-methyltransferase [Arthrobacter sp. GAS37]|uniref:prepilin peptidase n=1 Tax=Arthrobacter sp. GAS37 TaxID=3156261 RepID=UPI003832AE85